MKHFTGRRTFIRHAAILAGASLPYPQPRDEPLRYRAEVMAPGEDFDQTGFELPPAPEAPAEAAGNEHGSERRRSAPLDPRASDLEISQNTSGLDS